MRHLLLRKGGRTRSAVGLMVGGQWSAIGLMVGGRCAFVRGVEGLVGLEQLLIGCASK